MNFLVSVLLVTAGQRWTSAFNVEDVALYLPLLRNVQPHACPPNEMWQTCTGNCSDCARRKSCAVTECLSGCDCVPYHFRVEPGGPCVPVAQCPRPECGSNEVFRECGPVCERCGTLLCRMISCDYRCYCKEGHLRNEDGACVPKDECPKRSTCSHNEEWAESGPEDEYCQQEEGQEASNGTRQVAGCYCKEGLRRNSFGSCVRRCSGRCFGLSEYRACVPKCGVTCHSDEEDTCEEDGNCYPGCFCPAGHVMNEINHCVPREQCTTDIPAVKIVRGSGIMVEESSDSETTPSADGTTLGHADAGQPTEEVVPQTKTDAAPSDATTAAQEDKEPVTTGQEEDANEDI